MAKQINIGIVLNDSEVSTPPAGYVARFEKEVGSEVVTHYKNENGDVFSATAGVSTVNGVSGTVNLNNWDLTKWDAILGSNIAVPNGTTYNILESISDADKTASSAIGDGALSIQKLAGQDKIQFNWQGVDEWINIRIELKLSQGGTDFYRLQLRRATDDSVVSHHPFSINSTDQPESEVTINIFTFLSGATDSFVTGGIYLLLLNDSGGTVTIEDKINLLIQRHYKESIG